MPRKPLIFTDLDGTLLNHHNYDFAAALPLIQDLQQAQIPVIPVTSKTRSEVETLIQQLGLETPFVVENGSGIFIPATNSDWPLTQGERQGPYLKVELGCSYAQARQGLQQLAHKVGQSLRGFGDFTVAELQDLTNLSEADAMQAQARDFSEPFVLPADLNTEMLAQAATQLNLRVLMGGRFGHLLGHGAGKGKAVAWLVQQYQQAHPDGAIATIGLGDSPNDLELLAEVEYPVIVPGKTGQPHPQLLAQGWFVANAPAPQGWVHGVRHSLSQITSAQDPWGHLCENL